MLDRLLNAQIDPRRRDHTTVALLAAYVAVWSMYGAIAKGSQDIHFDMGELIVWSRETTWGTPKHPPLAAWLVRAWFRIFPLADWAYYLLAMTCTAGALWIAWKVFEPYLDGNKRVVGLVLLTLVPFYNFHALKFNPNTVMTLTWALTSWLFLRSYETRSPIYATLAGLAAAAAMLDKYWSIFLLLGLASAAICDRRRRLYFSSSAPWLTAAAGLAGLLPHLVWLWANHFKPFDYALTSHASSFWEALLSGLLYIAGGAGYIAVPALFALVAARPNAKAAIDTIRPNDPGRLLVRNAFALPFVFPFVAAVTLNEQIVSLWTIGGMTLFPVVLLSSPLVTIGRTATRNILMLGIVFPLLAAALSPIIAVVIHRQGVPNYATHYRLVAKAVEKAWQDTTSQPLRVVGSYNNLLYGTAFYFSEQPSALDISNPVGTPWVDEAHVARVGIALVCPTEQPECMAALAQRAAGVSAAKRTEVELSRRHGGDTDTPVRYVIVTIPPQAKQ